MTLPAKTAVAYCAGCAAQGEGLYLPVEDIGTTCPSEECGRKLRRRVGYICELCEMRNIFFTATDYNRHVAGGHE